MRDRAPERFHHNEQNAAQGQSGADTDLDFDFDGNPENPDSDRVFCPRRNVLKKTLILLMSSSTHTCSPHA
jgi:hypothetical protein